MTSPNNFNVTSPSAFSMASSSSLSTSTMCHEEMSSRIRMKLNVEKKMLWLPPYSAADTKEKIDEEETQALVTKYSQELNVDRDTVAVILEELRVQSIENVAAKAKFTESGIATLKVKLAGNIPPEVTERKFNVEVSLSVHGEALKEQICRKANLPIYMLKLICAGRVIDDMQLLGSQRVKHGNKVMAICLTESESAARREQQQALRFQETREAAQLLSNNEEVDDNSNYYLQIADQNGKPLAMPKEERKALVFAMTLHEKGRAAIKRKEYGEAVLLLLEADREFEKCSADILKRVDNYALVNLDIVWCYLCLRNVSELPNAKLKLDQCDQCFRRSYGPNLERLALVKGGTGTEKPLFLRLHLLQGILAFHQHNREEARCLLDRAENELRMLKVDDSVISQVMDLGFTNQEARLALRLTEGNVTMAVSHIMNKRQEKKELKEKEREEKRQKKVAKKLGKTANGELVNVTHYESLTSMGFPKGAASEALRQTNNDICASLEVLHSQPELLNLPDPEAEPFNVTDEMVAQVMALGFDSVVARAALEHTQNLQQAVEELMQRQGAIPQEWIDLANQAAAAASSSRPGSSRPPGKTQEEIDRENTLIKAVIEDLPEGEDDHLDLSLHEEEEFLMEYKAYLQSSQ